MVRVNRGLALRTSAAAAALIMIAAPRVVYAQAATFTFNIPRQDLSAALNAFGRTSHQQIVFDAAMLRGKSSSPLIGEFSIDEGLRTLLSGTGMKVAPVAGGVLAVRKMDTATPQSDPKPKSVSEEPNIGEVIVTSTRVARKVFTAPTPTTVLSEKDIEIGGRTNLQDVLNDLPQTTAQFNSTNQTTSIIGGSSLAQLRDLGVNRTLVLIDGARPVPTEFQTSNMGFDLNMIPLGIVKRVDVVTGGASASWGSDAVAGVVNIVMDDNFTGAKGDVQYGAATDGLGGDEYKVDLAIGSKFANGRGHFMGAFGYDDRAGIYPKDATPPGQYGLIANPAYTPTNGQPQDLFVKNVVYSDLSPGGLIVSGPLKGTTFGPGGSVGTFQYGQYAGSTFMAGGDPSAFRATDTEALASPLKRENFYGQASYDLNDNTVLYSDLLFGHTQTTNTTTPYTALGNLSISQNNAYLPISIRNLMVTDKLNTIAVGRLFTEFGNLEDQQENYTEQLKFGAKGAINNVWSWDSFASYGETERSIRYGNDPILANLANSVNAVVSPTTGQPVCAIALTSPATSCAPADIFGSGSISPAAVQYILGTSIMKMDLRQIEVAGNLRGDPFSLWAGPVSIATGLEFRQEAVTAHTDPTTAAGGFYINDGVLSDGSYTVGEGYLESVVPLARDVPLLKAFDFDGGVRVSDYSLSGVIPSWKLGLTDQVDDDLRLRAAYSRDIRAPNLTELFVKRTTTITTVTDPTNNSSVVATAYGGGNTHLIPETADSYTLGFVYNPKFMKGLGISIDYYNIDLQNAIGTLSAQLILNECNQGIASVCNQITRVNGVISSVSATEINIASYKASGFDFEVDYRVDPDALKIPGAIDFRFLATYINTLKENTGSSIVNLAGDISNGSPRVKSSATIIYRLGPMNFTARGRFVEGGNYSNQITVNATVPNITYFDLGLEYDIPGHTEYAVYANVDNVANALNPLNNNPIYHDIIGRTFNVGFRVRY